MLEMNDQAKSLRELKNRVVNAGNSTEVITVASGKGGVGKSNTSVNMALSLGSLGHRVLLIDVDLGLANADLLLGVYTKQTLFDFFERGMKLSQIISRVNDNVHLLSGGSALTDSDMLDNVNRELLRNELNDLMGYQFIIFDTGAGINKNVTYFSLIADRVILVTTPEPTSITDAYALLKSLYKSKGDINVEIVVNKATNEKEAKNTSDKLIKVSSSFLNKTPKYLGYISEDRHVQRAVKAQKPYSLLYEHCMATRDVKKLAENIIGKETKNEKRGLFNIFGGLFAK